jgi:RP/EB family microtubule-associated protein
MKCKMQDNLEFLQWIKRYWDQFFPGGEYDAVARRKGSGAPVSAGVGAPKAAANNSARRTAPTGGAARTRTPLGGGNAGASQAIAQENSMLKETVTGLERERDFYFSKLMDIEVLIQQEIGSNPEIEKDEGHVMKQIQTILYSTEVCLLLNEQQRLIINRRALRYPQKKVERLQRKRHSDLGIELLTGSGMLAMVTI